MTVCAGHQLISRANLAKEPYQQCKTSTNQFNPNCECVRRPSTTFWSRPGFRTPATSGAFWTSSSPLLAGPCWNTSPGRQTSWWAFQSSMLCCAVLCCAVPCCAVVLCAVLCCSVPCCAVPLCAVLCCSVLCCAVLCCAVLTCAAVLCRAVLCRCAVRWCAVLLCAVLCCSVLCRPGPPLQVTQAHNFLHTSTCKSLQFLSYSPAV